MRNKTLFVGGLLVLIFLASCGGKQKKPQTVGSFPVAVLTPQDAELQNVYPAVLKGEVDVEIKPRVDGYVEAVYIDEGSLVTKGQALFKINAPSAVNALETAQANYNTAKLDVERMRPLAEKNIISDVNLQSFENVYASAKAALENAKATMGWATVKSPINGVVGTIDYRLGSLVNSSSVLTTVANTSQIIAYFSMNEKEVYSLLNKTEGTTKSEKIKNMPEVKLVLSNDKEYDQMGSILTISGVVDENTGAVNFRAAFTNKNGLLLSGSSAKVVIPKYYSNVLMVPQTAAFQRQDKILVYKVEGDSVVQKLVSVLPTADGKKFVVLDGLVGGDKIVTEGIINLKNGQKIKIQ
ncbi:MAG: efflux RND transporter periplasmic adaptor subunit [Ignavibacteria bacterium]|jgi:membrane fusion protein (multidrug efflux system)